MKILYEVDNIQLREVIELHKRNFQEDDIAIYHGDNLVRSYNTKNDAYAYMDARDTVKYLANYHRLSSGR